MSNFTIDDTLQPLPSDEYELGVIEVKAFNDGFQSFTKQHNTLVSIRAQELCCIEDCSKGNGACALCREVVVSYGMLSLIFHLIKEEAPRSLR
jgi:hypothetical protein